MGIYNQTVEKLLMELDVEENILHNYDNTTYHIQFFMLPVHVQIDYFNKKNQLKDNDRELSDLLNKNKIIIAESGVSTNINIESLSMRVLSSNPTHGLSTAVDMTMKITEIGTGGLVNKIALLSKILGYETYVNQPYFITIWFNGYDHTDKRKGMPVGKINNTSYTYCVYISENKASIDDGTTSYTMKLINMTFEGMKKEWSIINNIGNITFEKGTTFKTAVGKIENRLNEIYKRNLGQSIVSGLYGNEDIIKIDVLEPNTHEIKSGTSKLTYNSCKEKITFKNDERVNLITLINDVWNRLNENTGYVPNVTFQPVLVGSANNRLYYRLQMNITPIMIPTLKDFIDSLYVKNDNISNSFLTQIEQVQETYLKEIHKMKALPKRYFYSYTGKNLDVIEYKQTEDHLWFLNTGASDIDAIELNSFSKFDSDIISSNSENYVPNVYIEKINSAREQNQGKKIFIDDVFRMLSKREMSDLTKNRYTMTIGSLNTHDAQTTNSNLNEDKDEQASDQREIDISQTIVGIGAENYLSTAQKVTLNMSIIGDPYWLEFGSEKDNGSVEKMFPHIILSLSTPMIPNSMDNYKADELMKITTLYQVHVITSTFSNGVFKQDLEGTIATPFIQTRNAKPIKVPKKSKASVSPSTSYDEDFQKQISSEDRATQGILTAQRYGLGFIY